MNKKEIKIRNMLGLFEPIVFARYKAGYLGPTYKTLEEASVCKAPLERRINSRAIRKMDIVDYYRASDTECIAIVPNEDKKRPANARRLDACQVRQIHQLFSDGKTCAQISPIYRVSDSVINQVVRGLTYRWVDKNTNDMKSNRKLTEDDVRRIRVLAAGGMSSYEIAKEYPVKPTSIRNVIIKKSYKSVKG